MQSQLSDEKIRLWWKTLMRLPEEKRDEYFNKLTSEDMIRIREATNPYRKPLYNPGEKILKFSYINMPLEYTKKFVTTSLVGFLYKMAYEYVDINLNSSKEISKKKEYVSESEGEFAVEYNNRIREYNIRSLERHYATFKDKSLEDYARWMRAKTITFCKLMEFKERELSGRKELLYGNEEITQTIVDDLEKEAINFCKLNKIRYEAVFPVDTTPSIDEIEQIKENLKVERGIKKTLQDKQRERQDQILDFLDYYLKYDPNHHIRLGYTPSYDKDLSEKIKKNPNAYKHIKYTVPEIGSSDGKKQAELIVTDKFEEYLIPPVDTFHAMNAYIGSNYEALRQATNTIYGDTSTFENVVIAREVFTNESKAKEWHDKYKDDFDMSVMDIPFGQWTYVDDWKENRDKTDINDEKNQLIKQMIETRKQEEKVGRDLLKKKRNKMPGRVDDKDLPFESQASQLGAERYTDEDKVEGKVYSTKLIRARRIKHGTMTSESLSIEPMDN